mgnify:FL=1
MFNKLSFLFSILTFNLFSLDIISLNFHNLDDDGSWAYDAQTIKNNERAGTSNYSSGSTITKEWNNILSTSSDNLEIFDNTGEQVNLEIEIGVLSPTWNNDYRNQPGMVGISAWPKMVVKNAISIEGIKQYADKYDIIFYVSYQKNSGFTSGILNIGSMKIPFTKENEVIICENFADDHLIVNLTNKSSGVNKGGVFIGGIQIIKR